MFELAYMSIEGMDDEAREILYSCVSTERRKELMTRWHRVSADLSLAAEGLARVMICRIVQQMEQERAEAGEWIPDDFPYDGEGTLTAKAIHIEREADGKPYQRTIPGLYFNYSHSDVLVACGVAGEEIGVDIQEVRHNVKIRERVYCQEEMQEDAAYDNDEFFAEIWAKKESYLKLTGEGMRREMRTLNVRKMQEDGEVWWHGGKIAEDCYLYICAEGKQKEIPKVQKICLREVIDFLKEQRKCEG